MQMKILIGGPAIQRAKKKQPDLQVCKAKLGLYGAFKRFLDDPSQENKLRLIVAMTRYQRGKQ